MITVTHSTLQIAPSIAILADDAGAESTIHDHRAGVGLVQQP
jgi:hypothetical protein